MALTAARRLNTQYADTVIGGHNYTGALRRRGQEAKYHFAVKDRDLLNPPGGPVEGDHYLMPATGAPAGAWAGFANGSLAAYHSGAWVNFAAAEGMLADIADEDIVLRYSGALWRKMFPAQYASTVGNGTNTIDVALDLNPAGVLVWIDGGLMLPAQITSVTPGTPAQGQTRVVFTFNIAAANAVVFLG